MLAAKFGYFRQSFTPRSITNLAAWWDCSDSSRYTLVSGVVSSFTDSTGTYTITQATAANRPSISAINGRGAFSFNGSSTSLFAGTSIASPFGTVFAVCVPTVTDNVARTVSYIGRTSPSIFNTAVGMPANRSALAVGGRVGGTFKILGANNTATANTAYVVSSTCDSSQTFSIRVNGAAGSNTTQPGLGGNSAGITLGCGLGNGSPNNLWQGTVGEVIWYARVLDSTEIGRVETYLKARWNISF